MKPALDARLVARVGDGDEAFHLDVELGLDAGVLVLFGASGAGKTLCLRGLAGLVPIEQGYVKVASQTLFDKESGVDLPPHRRGIGYVPQDQALFPFLDVRANVTFGLARSGRRGPGAEALLEGLGLASLAGRQVGSLSGGERQRVALARALAVRPRLLLLDEPFGALDRQTQSEQRALVARALEASGTAAVLVTHDPDDARELGSQLVVIRNGKSREAGAPAKVLGGLGDPLSEAEPSAPGAGNPKDPC